MDIGKFSVILFIILQHEHLNLCMNICCNFLPHTNAPGGKESGTTTESIRRDGVGHVVEGLRVQQELEDLQHHLGGQQGGVVLGHHRTTDSGGTESCSSTTGESETTATGEAESMASERATKEGKACGTAACGVINAREKRSARAA